MPSLLSISAPISRCCATANAGLPIAEVGMSCQTQPQQTRKMEAASASSCQFYYVVLLTTAALCTVSHHVLVIGSLQLPYSYVACDFPTPPTPLSHPIPRQIHAKPPSHLIYTFLHLRLGYRGCQKSPPGTLRDYIVGVG
jgi:hypothetical protein